MKKLIKVFVLISLLLAALTACGSANEVKLDAGDNGSQVELNTDQTLVISLDGNPTTGYTWEVAELDKGVLVQVGETEFEPDSDAVGAGGMQVLRFEVVNSGQTDLELVYHRSWEDEDPADTFSVQMVVR